MADEAEHQRVHLDRGDPLRPRGQGHEHVRAAAGTDDEGLRLLRRDLEGQRAVPVAHVAHARDVPVPLEDVRPGVGVDVEAREVGRLEAGHGVDARVGVPAGERDLRARGRRHVAVEPLRGGAADLEEARLLVDADRDEDEERRHHGGDAQARGEEGGRREGRDRDGEDGGLAAEPGEEERHGESAEGRSEEVGEVEPARDLASHGEEHRERDPGEEEGDERDAEVEGEPVRVEGHPYDEPEGQRDRKPVEEGEEGRTVAREGHPATQEVEREAAESPAEQRHRNGDEREVVPDRGREDARQPDLEHEAGERDEEDAEIEAHEVSFPSVRSVAVRRIPRRPARKSSSG